MPSPRQRVTPFLTAVGALALLLGGMWVAEQSGFMPSVVRGASTDRPWAQAFGKLVAVFVLMKDAGPAVGTLWLAIAGFGYPLRRWLAPQARHRLVVQLGAGLAGLLLLDWLLALCGWMNGWTAWLLGGAGGCIFIWELTGVHRRGGWHPDTWPNPPWTLALGLPAIGLFAVACALPPATQWRVEAFGYDALSYHLQLPQEWLVGSATDVRTGTMRGLHHNVFSYLPDLVEAGYMQLGAMKGSMYNAVFATQLFHATTAALAAVAVACVVSRHVGRAAGVLAAVVMIAMPWVVITGSLPYDEMAALALAAVALMLVFDPVTHSRRGIVLAGFLAGATALAKLTIGAMVVPGLAAVIALGWNQTRPWREPVALRQRVWLVAVFLVVSAATLSPWLIRNAAWTGNPVFPLATRWFGAAHWTPQETQRWNTVHGAGGPDGIANGAVALGEQWLLSSGYGAVAASAVDPSPQNIARFDAGNGFPIFWFLVAAATGAAVASRTLRPPALAMLLLLASTLAVWVLFTHHQSRFLVPTVLPACALVGLGAGRLEHATRFRSRWALPALAILVMLLLTLNLFTVFFRQTRSGPPWVRVDSLARGEERLGIFGRQDGEPHLVFAAPGSHPINWLDANQHNAVTVLVADAQAFYIVDQHRILYHSAFDRETLGDAIRESDGNPLKVTALMRQYRITHVWINWDELKRLSATYTYDPSVTEESLRKLIAGGGWRVAWSPLADDKSIAALYELPDAK